MFVHALSLTACTKIALEYRAYLREFAAEFKIALARETGGHVTLFDEKPRF
jgi:hypothetical protein